MKTPCDNCISFAICNSSLKNISTLKLFLSLPQHCSILDMWLFKHKRGHTHRLKSIIKLYHMKDIKTHLYKKWKDGNSDTTVESCR